MAATNFFSGYNLLTIILIVVYAFVAVILSYKRNQHKLLFALPGLSASIGVLFTFVVLYFELKGFSIVGKDDSFLEVLVRKLSAAFSTSIIGLIGSVTSSWFVKWRQESLEQKDIKNRPELQKHPHVLLHEIVLSNQAVSQELRFLRGEEQPASMYDINRSLSNLNEGVLSEIQTLFQSLDQKLEQAIKDLGADALKDTTATLAGLNEAFSERTANLLEENLAEMRKFFEENKRELERTAHEHAQQSESINQGLEDTRQKLNVEMEAVRETFTQSAQQIADSLSEQSAGMQVQLKESLDELNAKIGSVQSSFGSSVDSMSEKYKAKADELRAAYEKIETELRGLSTNVQQSVQEILNSNLAQLNSAFDRIETLQGRATTNLSQATKEFADAVDKYQITSNHQEAILQSVASQQEELAVLRENMQQLIEGWSAYDKQLQVLHNRVTDITNIVFYSDQGKGASNGTPNP